MTEMTDAAGLPTRKRRARRGAAPDAVIVEDRGLAILHLRLGALSLARAELEDLRRRGGLEATELADLAEARWRSGDLEAADAAAAEHLAAGGTRPIAFLIAAEAAAAAGRPVEARAHVDASGVIDAATLEGLFAGMPRRAFWPSAPSVPVGPSEAPGLWDGEAPASPGRPTPRGLRPPSDAADQLARAREELGSRNTGDTARGVARLALVLRLDPMVATAVLDLVGPRRDAAAMLVRGDAYGLLGRHLEAEAAYVAAGRALDSSGTGRPA